MIGPSGNPNEGAAFHPNGNYYTINSNGLMSISDWGKGKDAFEISSFLTTHPKERAQLVDDTQDMMLHEGWHSAQFAKYPLQGKYDVPLKDYIQLEYEAKMKAAGAYMERVEAERKARQEHFAHEQEHLRRRGARGRVEAGLSGQRRLPSATSRADFLTSTNAADLSEGIKLQKPGSRSPRTAPRRSSSTPASSNSSRPRRTSTSASRRSPRPRPKARRATSSPSAWRSSAESPNNAMNALWKGAEGARKGDPKWYQANRTSIEQSFNTAIDAEKKLLPKECSKPSDACTKRQDDLNGSCRYIGRDPC